MNAQDLYIGLKKGVIKKSQLSSEEIGQVYNYMIGSNKISSNNIKPEAKQKYNIQEPQIFKNGALIDAPKFSTTKPASNFARDIGYNTFNLPKPDIGYKPIINQYNKNNKVSVNPENELVDTLSTLSTNGNRYGASALTPQSRYAAPMQSNNNNFNMPAKQENKEITWQNNPSKAAGANIWAGFGDLGRGFANVVDMTLGDKNIPIVDNYLEKIKSDIKVEDEKLSKINQGKVGEFAGDVFRGVGQSIPSVAVSLAGAPIAGANPLLTSGGTQLVNNAAQLANPSLLLSTQQSLKDIAKNPNLLPSMIQSVGNQYGQAINSGATKEQAIKSALIGGIPSGLIEVMGGTENLAEKLASKMSIGKATIESGLGEALEEILQYPAENIGQKIAYDKDMPLFSTSEQAIINPKEQLKAGATAFVSSALMGGAGTAINSGINKIADNRQMEKYNQQISNMQSGIDEDLKTLYNGLENNKLTKDNIEQDIDGMVKILEVTKQGFPELTDFFDSHIDKLNSYKNGFVNKAQIDENINNEQLVNGDVKVAQNLNNDAVNNIGEVETQPIENIQQTKNQTIHEPINKQTIKENKSVVQNSFNITEDDTAKKSLVTQQDNNEVDKTANEEDNIFSKQVDEWIEGKFNKKDHLIILKKTPEIYKQFGVNDLPITIASNKLDRIINSEGKQKNKYHGLGVDITKQLPKAIESPLSILKSHNNSFVIVTNLVDNENRPIIASMLIDGVGRIEDINIAANVLTSAYGRENYNNYMERNNESGNVVYDSTSKEPLGSKLRLLGSEVTHEENNQGYVSESNIPQNNDSVNMDTKESENSTTHNNQQQQTSTETNYSDKKMNKEGNILAHDADNNATLYVRNDQDQNPSYKDNIPQNDENINEKLAQEKTSDAEIKGEKKVDKSTQNFTDEKGKDNQYELKNQLDDLISKLAIATTEQEKVELNDKIAKLKLQLFANNISSYGEGEFKVSKFYLNSSKNALYIPENVKEMLNEVDYLYEIQTNEGQLKEALKNIEEDMNAVIDKIKNSASLKNGVQSAEALLIHKIYIEQGKISGDYSKAIEWSKTIRPKITNTAQSLQAISMFKRFTADNMLLQATRTAEESRTRSEDDKINRTAGKIKDGFDKAEKEKAGEVASDLEKNANNELAKKKAKDAMNKKQDSKKPTKEEIDEIDSSDLLVAKIESTLKDEEAKPIERDFVSEMVDELFRVAKESPLPQREVINNKISPVEFMAQAIKNKGMYKETWLQAKDKLKEKYQNKTETFDILSDYFEKGINPTFSLETLDKSISRYIVGLKANKETLSKEKLINLSKVVKDWYATGKAKNESMVESIIKESKLDEDDAKTLEKYVRNRMHDLTKQKKEQILSTMFNERVPKVDGSAYKAIQEMTNLGAFNNEKYKTKAMKRLDSSLNRVLKENNIDMGKIAKQAAIVCDFNKGYIQGLLSAKLQLNERELTKISSLIAQTFDEILSTKKGQLLRQITKEREVAKKRAFYEKIVEIYNLGGFETDEHKELIAKKLNLPNLDDETVAKIVELATALEQIPEKGLYNLILRDIVQNQMVYIIKNMVPTSRARKVSTVQAIMQLSNPKTMDRNVLGNEFAYRSERMARYLATLIDKGRTKLTGGERKITFKAGTKIFDFDTKFTSNVKKAAAASMKGYKLYGYDATSDTTNLQKAGKTFRNVWNPFTHLETFMNVTLDGPDYAAAMRGVYNFVAEQAYLDSINKGLTGKELEDNAKKFADNLSFEAFKAAREYGDWVTFKDKDSVLGNFFGGLKKTLNKVGVEDFGLGEILLKYARTGGVLLGRSIEFSPIGILTSYRHIYQAKTAYENKQVYAKDVTREVEISIARGIFGTIGFSGLGYALSALGIVSGDDDDNKLVSELRRKIGLGNYQINMSALFRWITSFDKEEAKFKQGDKLFTYNWAMPMALSFGFGVDVERGFSKKSKDMGKGIVTGALASIDGMMSMFGQSNLMTGINNLFKGYDKGKNIQYMAQNAVTGFTGTFNNQLRQLFDNAYRDTKSDNFVTETINKIINRLPILSGALPESYDITGYPKEVFQNDSNTIFNVFFNPGFLTEYEASPGVELMLDLYKDTESVKVIPNEAPEFLTIDSIKIPLTNEEIQMYKETLGRTTIEYMDRIALDDDFKKLSKEKQAAQIEKTINKIASMVRKEMRTLIIQRYHEESNQKN